MPSTLRRSRRRELVLTRSFTKAIQDKMRPESPRADGDQCRTFFADRTNARSHTPFASTFEASSSPSLTSRPSMILSLYHSVNPHLPVHPIHRLPPELLVHVFALGTVDDVMFPVLVSHVCHSWRAIALHAHMLWRRVSLNPKSNLHMWKERIGRARLYTLDVVLASLPCPRTLYDIDTVTIQMHHLITHFYKLRSLEIQFNSYAPYLWNAAIGPFCQLSSHFLGFRCIDKKDFIKAPVLESLTLRHPQNDDDKLFTLFGGIAPKLARLTLEGIRLEWLPELFGNLFFLDYTHHGFSCGQLAAREILSMLQISSRVRELRLCIYCKPSAFERSYSPSPMVGNNVALPSLESLTLCLQVGDVDIPPEINEVVSRLQLPNLKNLYLRDPWGADPGFPLHQIGSFPALPVFMDTISRCTSLSNLVADGRWVDPSLLSKLRAQLPSLTSIQVGTSRVKM